MVLSFSRAAAGVVVLCAIVFGAAPVYAGVRELATAQGTIAISDARPGLRAPACSELIVEARDALDNHLIADTQPTADETGACRYSVSVPAQSAVWLRVQPACARAIVWRCRPNRPAVHALPAPAPASRCASP
jgi:hypothetical protein